MTTARARAGGRFKAKADRTISASADAMGENEAPRELVSHGGEAHARSRAERRPGLGAIAICHNQITISTFNRVARGAPGWWILFFILWNEQVHAVGAGAAENDDYHEQTMKKTVAISRDVVEAERVLGADVTEADAVVMSHGCGQR